MQLFNSPSNNTDAFAVDANIESELVYDNCQDNSPLVSIMIPTYKRPELVIDAIKSATAQVTALSFEIVIVDNDQNDASIERTIKVALDLGVTNFRYFKNVDKIGLYGNWSRCLQLARGKWLTILNDDDLLDCSWLETIYAATQEHHDATVVACGARYRDLKGKRLPKSLFRWAYDFLKMVGEKVLPGKIKHLDALDYFISMPHNGSLGSLILKDAAIGIGGFDNSFYPSSDYVFFAKNAMFNKAILIPATLVTYGIGDNNFSKPEVVYGAVKVNKQIQLELIPFININKNILLKYIEIFSILSVSGVRSASFTEETKTKYSPRELLNPRSVTVDYYVIKSWLILLSKVYGRRLRIPG